MSLCILSEYNSEQINSFFEIRYIESIIALPPCRWDLEWYLDIFRSLTQCMATYCTSLHIDTIVRSRIFTAVSL
jgi:hypothetical protein